MNIREATREDFDQIWPIFHEIAAAGETYAYPRDITKEQALKLWIDGPRKTYVFEEDGKILGTYFIKTNHSGPGEHVCNCGYMVSSAARGAWPRHRYVRTFPKDRPRTWVQGYAVQFCGVQQ